MLVDVKAISEGISGKTWGCSTSRIKNWTLIEEKKRCCVFGKRKLGSLCAQKRSLCAVLHTGEVSRAAHESADEYREE